MAAQRVLLAVTGGVAAYKIPELVRSLSKGGYSVRCALTHSASKFVSPTVLEALTGETVRIDLFEAEESRISHIQLADWADVVVVAPATANSLAKFAHGIADNLVSTLLLATRAPVLIAPAMNVNMWEHPATQENLRILRKRGVHVVGPDSGFLACGWEGAGRMVEPEQIAGEVALLLGSKSLSGETVLVTAGGTQEPIDSVRVLANRSSGKMGFAVAAEAALRGAQVILIAAPSALPTPAGVERIDVRTAKQMYDAVFEALPRATVVIKAAAVADFRPQSPSEGKIKKETLPEGEGPALTLVQNPDILAAVCREKGSRIVVGFAAESDDVVGAARRKLVRKGCDLLVANDISRADSGFEVDQNEVVLVSANGDVEELPRMDKAQVAKRIWDRIEKLRENSRVR